MPEGAASSHLTPRNPILIEADWEFTAENGVRRGTGSFQDPYVIEGWEIATDGDIGIWIRNTRVAFVIRDVYVYVSGEPRIGIRFDSVANGRVEDSSLSGHWKAIDLYSGFRDPDTTGIAISRNAIIDNEIGIQLWDSHEIELVGNVLSSNSEWGVVVTGSSKVEVRDNQFSDSGLALHGAIEVEVTGNNFTGAGVEIRGGELNDYNTHTITPDNFANGRPILYYKDCSDLELEGIRPGQLLIANCTGVRIARVAVDDTTIGLELGHVRDAVVTEGVFRGNTYGLMILSSVGVTVSRNTLSENQFGVRVQSSNEVTFLHNSFLTNEVQAFDGLMGVFWDAGYPTGGNYWSDYAGPDGCSGPDQSVCHEADGIGDLPYAVWRGVLDRYPLMRPMDPSNAPPVVSFTVTPTNGQDFAVVGNASDSYDREDPGPRLELRWDWEDDGLWDTRWSQERIALHEYPERGAYRVRLAVRDTQGSVSHGTEEVGVGDTTPPLISHDPLRGISLTPVLSIRARVTDDEAVGHVLVHYASHRSDGFTSLPMIPDEEGAYFALIPGPSGGMLRYFITAVDAVGNEARDPPTGALVVDLDAGSGRVSPAVLGIGVLGATLLVVVLWLSFRKIKNSFQRRATRRTPP